MPNINRRSKRLQFFFRNGRCFFTYFLKIWFKRFWSQKSFLVKGTGKLYSRASDGGLVGGGDLLSFGLLKPRFDLSKSGNLLEIKKVDGNF